MSGVGPEENLDVALGAAMAVLPHVGLLSARRALRARGRRRADRASLEVAGAVKGARTAG